jgi:lipopolysaccharide export system protein LptA
MIGRLAVLMSLAAALPAQSPPAKGAPAPTGRCAFDVKFDRVTGVLLPSGQRNNFFGGNIVATCPKQKIVLKSDSLEIYGDEGRFYFVGHVNYTEPRLKLKSDFLTYFQKEERFLASFNVDATMPSGSNLKGTSLEYFRDVPRVRTQKLAIAVARPTITITEKDPQGKTQQPVTVTGNTVWLVGDSIVSSSGDVVVVRPELTATGDSLYLDGGKGLLRIMRKPKINGTKGRPFTLVGETIDLLSRQRKIDRVLALKSAEAVSEDLNLKSDTIDLRVKDDLLQRAVAWGKSRATATSPSQTIISDSIDVLMPGQRVREMHAVRKASAEGLPDTTKFKTTERDRLTGDTIIATFDTIAVNDTSRKPQIKTLTAIGNATSYQHLPAQNPKCKLPAINYVKGKTISVTFDSAQVKKVIVADTAGSTGLNVEPDSTCVPPAAAATPTGNAPATPPARAPRQETSSANMLFVSSKRVA